VQKQLLLTKIVFLLTIFFLSGCRQLDPNYSEPMINGYLYRVEYYDRSIEYERYVEVSDNRGLRMVPVVTLNNELLKVLYYSWTKYGYGDTYQFPLDTFYELKVTHYWGNAWAKVAMPGNFSLLSPPEGYVLDMESTLVISWTRSSRAEWYWVEVDIEYEYRDTLNQEDDLTFGLDTMVFDTFYIIPSSRIFPGFVSDVIEGDGSVMVWAGCGPAIEPGDRGNVQGVGFGFFNAINEPREKYFYVGAPIVNHHQNRRGKGKVRLPEKLYQRIILGRTEER